MAYTGQHNTNTDEQLGVFSGYLRRPIPNVSGMTAQIFGENGDDADTIVVLSLTKFLDVQVFVNVYLIKDPNGQIMKQGDSYPLISSFLGFIKRSAPKKEGMIAQIFAPNGEDADSIADLGKSIYQDALVFVDIRGSLAKNNTEQITKENILEIDAHYSDKITKVERVDLARKEKLFRKMNEHLEFGDFLYRIEVLKALSKGEDFKQWLVTKHTCAHQQDKPCTNDSGATLIDGLIQPYNYLPCCQEHEKDLHDPIHFEKNRLYYEMKHRLLTRQWTWDLMKYNFSFDGKGEPDPTKVIEWAASKNLTRYLPSKYQSIT